MKTLRSNNTKKSDDPMEAYRVFHRPPHRPAAENGDPPRLLTKAQAAHYCALSSRGFSAWVKLGRLPGPIAGTTRWDRHAIDAALDEAMSKVANENADTYNSWKARYHENKSKGNPHSKKETR